MSETEIINSVVSEIKEALSSDNSLPADTQIGLRLPGVYKEKYEKLQMQTRHKVSKAFTKMAMKVLDQFE